jgi:hypothetical protein
VLAAGIAAGVDDAARQDGGDEEGGSEERDADWFHGSWNWLRNSIGNPISRQWWKDRFEWSTKWIIAAVFRQPALVSIGQP